MSVSNTLTIKPTCFEEKQDLKAALTLTKNTRPGVPFKVAMKASKLDTMEKIYLMRDPVLFRPVV